MPPHLFSKFLVLQGLHTKATCALYSNCNTRKEWGQKECPAVRADIVGYWAEFCSSSTAGEPHSKPAAAALTVDERCFGELQINKIEGYSK